MVLNYHEDMNVIVQQYITHFNIAVMEIGQKQVL